MAWEYLKTDKFAERYKVVADFLPDTSEMVILDLNCGEPRFREFIKYKKYIATDINEPDNVDGIDFYQIKDKEVDFKADVVCLFGCGAAEFTGHFMESPTERKTLKRLIKHKPKFVVIESAKKWQDDFQWFGKVEEVLVGYTKVFEKLLEINEEVDGFPADHYHNERLINIYERDIQK